MAAKKNKTKAHKKVESADVWHGNSWVVKYGELKRGRGNPGNVANLFKVVGEKLPFDSLAKIKAALVAEGLHHQGVYLAHDSMGCPRYGGRGDIFSRLKQHKDAHPDELSYFSFYVVAEKKHEREVETLLIRGASFLLEFNDRKRRVGVEPGDIRDFEAGTHFFERQRKRGRKAKRKK